MVGRDSRLAELFFVDKVPTARDILESTLASTAAQSKTGLTLENLKLHDRAVQEANNQFLPKMSRLMQQQQNRRNTTEFTSKFSIFDALYELEVTNDTVTKPSQMTQEEYHDILLENLLQVDRIEQEFGKVHLLVDRLMRPKSSEKVQQNSFLFHMKFAMLLSSMVQMKNSLIKYLDYESSDRPRVPTETQFKSEESESTSEVPPNARQNMHMLIVTDDMGIVDHSIQTLKSRGVRIVQLPSAYDMANLLPFLLINDHSILVIRHPHKDVT
jgi:hypothetical protein